MNIYYYYYYKEKKNFSSKIEYYSSVILILIPPTSKIPVPDRKQHNKEHTYYSNQIDTTNFVSYSNVVT